MKKRGNNKENQNPVQFMYQVIYIINTVISFITDVIDYFSE
jgi:hypothetical protein